MAVNWLKGLVAPAAQFVASPQAPGAPMPPYVGQPAPDAPPIGGQPYAAPIGAPPPPTTAVPPTGIGAGGILDPSQWQTGTRTQGSAPGGPVGGSAAASGAPGGLEARCKELENDVASLALFARTLLTMLEDKQVVTRQQFLETKNRLDALDGKIDDR